LHCGDDAKFPVRCGAPGVEWGDWDGIGWNGWLDGSLDGGLDGWVDESMVSCAVVVVPPAANTHTDTVTDNLASKKKPTIIL